MEHAGKTRRCSNPTCELRPTRQWFRIGKNGIRFCTAKCQKDYNEAMRPAAPAADAATAAPAAPASASALHSAEPSPRITGHKRRSSDPGKTRAQHKRTGLPSMALRGSAVTGDADAVQALLTIISNKRLPS